MNMFYCCLFLSGKLIVKLFFETLRPIEKQMMYDRLLNYLLMKTVLVGAVLEPQISELLFITMWLTLLGYLRIFGMLCRDRFEYVRDLFLSFDDIYLDD